MSGNDQLIQIALAREDIKKINEMARNIYMTALNAMLKARRTSSNNQGYTRVTAELRKFSVRMETSMQDLSILASEIVKTVATQRKQKRISGILDRAEQEVETRKNKNSLQLLQHIIKLMLVRNGGQGVTDLYGRFSISVERLYPLCRLGQNVAVLAKVEAMYVAEDVDILHGIAEEMDRIINNVEHQLDIVSARFAA